MTEIVRFLLLSDVNAVGIVYVAVLTLPYFVVGSGYMPPLLFFRGCVTWKCAVI